MSPADLSGAPQPTQDGTPNPCPPAPAPAHETPGGAAQPAAQPPKRLIDLSRIVGDPADSRPASSYDTIRGLALQAAHSSTRHVPTAISRQPSREAPSLRGSVSGASTLPQVKAMPRATKRRLAASANQLTTPLAKLTSTEQRVGTEVAPPLKAAPRARKPPPPGFAPRPPLTTTVATAFVSISESDDSDL